MELLEILGTAAGIGFLAGIRLYATVLCLGALMRGGLMLIPEPFAPALVLASLAVLIPAGLLAVVEFLADKAPGFDSLWDTFHTLIRPAGALLLALTASAELDAGWRTVLALTAGGAALASHAANAAARAAVHHSPEPFPSWTLSLAEDLFIPLGLWLTVHFPSLVLILVAVFLLVILARIRPVARNLRKRWRPAPRHKAVPPAGTA